MKKYLDEIKFTLLIRMVIMVRLVYIPWQTLKMFLKKQI